MLWTGWGPIEPQPAVIKHGHCVPTATVQVCSHYVWHDVFPFEWLYETLLLQAEWIHSKHFDYAFGGILSFSTDVAYCKKSFRLFSHLQMMSQLSMAIVWSAWADVLHTTENISTALHCEGCCSFPFMTWAIASVLTLQPACCMMSFTLTVKTLRSPLCVDFLS